MFKKVTYFNKYKLSLLAILFVGSMLFSGCSKIDNLKVKIGLKNTDFEYIKQNKIQKIVIQNTRDKGYRFVVKDKKAIKELYNILSSAKEVKEKSTLKPDYVFEMHEDHDKVHKFNYVAGLDKKNGGNLYSEDKIYIVSKRIDNDIIQNFWNVRIPKDFTEIYYGSILQAVEKYRDKNSDGIIGIKMNEDIEMSKFILSADLENFKGKLNDKFENVKLASNNDYKSDVEMVIKTQGYKRLLYKSTINFHDKKEKSNLKYYIVAKYENRSWDLTISETKPKDF